MLAILALVGFSVVMAAASNGSRTAPGLSATTDTSSDNSQSNPTPGSTSAGEIGSTEPNSSNPQSSSATESFSSSPSPSTTAFHSPTATLEGDSASTATEMPNPPSGENLLVNGDFMQGLADWQSVNGYWQVHGPRPCEPTGTQYAEMDRDGTSNDTWPLGGEDWLWQDVAAPDDHSVVVLRMLEAHHMQEQSGPQHTGFVPGVAELTVYGRDSGSAPWQVVFFRPSVESPYGTGKCSAYGPPAAFEYVFPASFAFYRLEVHGEMANDGDGFLFGGFELIAGR